MEYIGKHTYRMQNGTEFEADYGGVIGLSPEGQFYTGYDGFMAEVLSLRPKDEEELCLWMAEQWGKAAERARSRGL